MPPHTNASIIVLRSVNTVLVIRGPKLPRPGETVLGGEFFQAAGGKGANQAVAAARASEAPVLFIAAVGDDDFGRAALAGLGRENLNTRYIRRVPGQPTGVALILVDELGENLISVASGANLHLTPDDVDAVPRDVFTQAKVFLASLESPLATVARGLERAKETGLLTVLNPAPATEQAAEPRLLGLVDVLTPNKGEAVALAGIDVRTEADCIAAAQRLRKLGCRAVVVTRGPEGCVVVAEQVTAIAGHAVTAIDATAAGDAFNGALAVALAEGQPLLEAARWANRASAISVTRRGAQPSLPTRAEIEGERNAKS